MKILISGLVNIETTVPVRQFPVEYYPIDYPFFGVQTAVSGVAYNIAKALRTLGDDVALLSMTGNDFPGEYIRKALENCGISPSHLRTNLRQSPSSVVLYDPAGKRQIYCDLKDIQESAYDFTGAPVAQADLVVACNINFNRALLPLAKATGKCIATDVHVLTQVHDEYNRDFMEAADILFLSDEGISGDYRAFLLELVHTYHNRIIVLGRGAEGAAMYLAQTGQVYEMPAVTVGPVVNTVGTGDALFSAFVHYFAKGMEPLQALQRAQTFAAAKICVTGAANGFWSETQLEQWISEQKSKTEERK